MATVKPTAIDRIRNARTVLLLDHAFFGALIFRLIPISAPSIPTMATDGKSLFYNPSFVDELPPDQLVGVLAHEVMHPARQTRPDDDPRKPWKKPPLGGQHRADERPRARDRGKMVAEEHELVRRVVVHAVTKPMRPSWCPRLSASLASQLRRASDSGKTCSSSCCTESG